MNMYPFASFMEHVIFFAGGLSLLIAVSELFVRQRRSENYLFCALLGSFGVLMFQIGWVLNGTAEAHPWLMFLHISFLFLVAPIGYFCFYLIILPSDTLPPRIWLYLLPLVISLACDVYYMTLAPAAQSELVRMLVHQGTMSDYLPARIIIAFSGLHIFVYLTALFLRFLSILLQESRSAVLLLTMGYLVYTVCAADMVAAGYAFASPPVLRVGCFLMAAIFIVTFITAQRYPRYLQLIIDESEKRTRTKSLLTGRDVDALIQKLDECMTRDRLYRSDELTLKDLARELSISTHQLSQLLNEKMGTSFNNYVNRYRIEEAKELLLGDPDRSVISVAFEVGFNTKSSFYYAFSRFTGVTPQDYRKEKEK